LPPLFSRYDLKDSARLIVSLTFFMPWSVQFRSSTYLPMHIPY